MWILDTDVCIELQRGRSPRAAAQLAEVEPGDVTITIVSLAELHYGASKSARPESALTSLIAFLQPFEILPLTTQAAISYGGLKAFLARRGNLIGSMDILIAAIALENDAILVTNNVRDFSRVPGLRIENWIRGPSA